MELTWWTWRCDRCGAHGRKRIGPRVDLWSGVQRILDAHRRCVQGTCDGGADTIRLFTGETLKEVTKGA